jgi:predicted PurR-regulated permease PerM
VEGGVMEARLRQWFMWLGILGMVLLFLIFGRSFLVPIVVAFLVFTVLSAAVDALSKIRVGTLRPPYWLAVVIGLGVVAIAILVLYNVVTVELALFIEEWPRFAERARSMLDALSAWIGTDLIEALRVIYDDFSLLPALRRLVTPAGIALTSIIIIILYVAFLFVESSRFPAKIDLIFNDPARAAQFKDASGRIIAGIHRYLLLKTLLCAANAIVAYMVMKFVGLEFAEAWAVLVFFLFFIPKIGPIVATILPTLFAIVQFQAWQPVLMLLAGIGILQTIIGEVVEPRVMGRSLNLSPLVILLALTFWAMIWGLAGAFLAIPLTVVILTVCSKVPALRPVAILLSKDGHPDAQRPEADAISGR